MNKTELPGCPECGKHFISLVGEISVGLKNYHIASSFSPVASPTFAQLYQCDDCKTIFVSRDYNHYQPFEIVKPKKITQTLWEELLKMWNNSWKDR